MKTRTEKVPVTLTWDRFSEVIQKAVRDGNKAEVVLRDKKGKSYLRATFRLETPSPDEVRIPCLIVPPSPFHPKPKARTCVKCHKRPVSSMSWFDDADLCDVCGKKLLPRRKP